MQLLKDIPLAQREEAASDTPCPEQQEDAQQDSTGPAKTDEARSIQLYKTLSRLSMQVQPDCAGGHVAGDEDPTLPMPEAEYTAAATWPPKPWFPKSDVRRWMGYRAPPHLKEPLSCLVNYVITLYAQWFFSGFHTGWKS